MRIAYPSKATLDALFYYQPDTGKLIGKTRRGAMPAGSEAGSLKASRRGLRHRTVCVGGQDCLVHRAIWIMVHGSIPDEAEIDHEDGDGLNNRLLNLKLVTHQGNQRNRSVGSNNKSGCMGVYRRGFHWIASIRHNGKTVSLGKFRDKAKAIASRKAAERRFGYHPNHGKVRPGYEPAEPSWKDFFWA